MGETRTRKKKAKNDKNHNNILYIFSLIIILLIIICVLYNSYTDSAASFNTGLLSMVLKENSNDANNVSKSKSGFTQKNNFISSNE